MIICDQAGSLLRIEMVRCGYTLDSLSDTSGISRDVLRCILNGRSRSVSTRTLCALAPLFGCSAAELTDLLAGVSADQ